jgi:predicted Kef-type K+ transport protein
MTRLTKQKLKISVLASLLVITYIAGVVYFSKANASNYAESTSYASSVSIAVSD